MNQSYARLGKMIIECDIPLKKVNLQSFKKWYEEEIKIKCPDELTLRKYYVRNIYQEIISKIQ